MEGERGRVRGEVEGERCESGGERVAAGSFPRSTDSNG
jgi:hypothetical protein